MRLQLNGTLWDTKSSVSTEEDPSETVLKIISETCVNSDIKNIYNLISNPDMLLYTNYVPKILIDFINR